MVDHVVTAFDGTRLAVRDHGGDGPDVLFLHGRSRSLADWPPVLRHLDGVRAVSMDARWHGRSSTGGAVGVDALVGDIDAVLDALRLERPLIVGHSMGGVIATHFAAARNTCCGVLNIDGLDARRTELPRGGGPARRAGRLDHGDDDWHTDEVARLRREDADFGAPDNVTDAFVERAFAQDPDGTWHRRPPTAFYELPVGAGADAYPVAVEKAFCPVTVLLCTGDRKTPSGRDVAIAAMRSSLHEELEPLVATVPDFRLQTIDGSHAVIFEKPSEIASIVRSLL